MKYAIYDMCLHAPAFDFVQFCIVSKSRCAAMGEECHIIFKMGPNRGFKEPNDKPYTVEEKKFRMTHIMYPICTMMGLDYSTGIIHDVDDSKVLHPKNDSFILTQILEQYKEAPLYWPQPSDHATEIVQKSFPEKPVVITLRETYSAGRNSDLKEWMKFSDHVTYFDKVIFIRDTSKWNESLYDDYFGVYLPTFPIASIDLDIRLALYRHAKMNFSVGGGPTSLLRFSVDNPYRAFKLVNKEIINKDKSRPPKQVNISRSEMGSPAVQAKLKDGKSSVVFINKEDVLGQLRRGQHKISAYDQNGNPRMLIVGDSKYVEEAVKDRPGSVENWTKYGFPPGSQLPWHTKNQKIIWEDDTFENLRDAYEEWSNE